MRQNINGKKVKKAPIPKPMKTSKVIRKSSKRA